MPTEGAARELLEALGLEAGSPSPGSFEELFLRFQARVPFRRGPAAPSGDPAVLLRRFLEEGRGGGGAERREAFAFLARGLGYRVDAVAARREDGSSHGALVASLANEEVLADVALPLPVLVPLSRPGTQIPSALGTLGVERDGSAWRLLLSARGRTALLLESAPGTGATFAGAGSPAEDDLLRFLPDRVLRWTGGRMVVEDAWSRLAFPLPGGETETLGALFDQPAEDLVGIEASPGPPVLTVYHAAPEDPSAVRARLLEPDRFARLLPPGHAATGVERTEDGWKWDVADETAGVLRGERVRLQAAGIHVTTLTGDHPVAARRFVVEPDGSGSRLVLEAILAKSVPATGLPDSVRRTLVFHLAAELIALADPR